MNGRIILLSVPFFIILACHKKGIPTITARQDKPLSLQTENFVTDINAGRMIFIAKCKRCHVQPDPLTYNAQRWDSILSVMMPRARLTKEEANNVTAYIKANCSK